MSGLDASVDLLNLLVRFGVEDVRDVNGNLCIICHGLGPCANEKDEITELVRHMSGKRVIFVTQAS